MASFQKSTLTDRVGVALLAVLTIAFIAHLYFLSSYSVRSPLPLSSQAIQDQRLHQLEAAISRLELQNAPIPSAKSKEVPEDAYQRGLRQHEALLNEVRTELKLTEDQLRESGEAIKTARETTQRIQDAETAFLAIFGIIGAFIAGQGYLQIRGWNERAQDALKEVEDVRPDLESIRDARESLETELPTFLDAARGILSVEDATGPIQQEHITLMDQIDHFTYLSAPMRFRKIHSEEEAGKYIEALRVAARGHLARSAIWEATSRLNEFFALAEKFPKAVTEKHKALAYSYRAVAAYQQVTSLLGEPSWVRNSKLSQIVEIRDRAFVDVRRAHECYPQQNYGDFVEALLYSLPFAPDSPTSAVAAQEVKLRGQKKAAELYRTLIPAATGRKRRASLQNLACCLKRIAGMTGETSDYLAFKTEVNSYPSDKQLWEETSSVPEGRIELTSLWQGIMSDAELFASTDRLDAMNYKAFWISLLDQKVVLRQWRDDLAELQSRNPKMKEWAVIL